MEYSLLDRPEQIPKVFTEAWNNRDATKLASLFDPDAEFVNVTGLWWHNREAIQKAHTYGLSTIFSTSTLSLVQTRVKYLADHIAIVQANMVQTGQTPIGGVAQPGTRRTIFTFVVHKVSDAWSCASAQNTDIVPNMETHVRDEEGNLRPVDYRQSDGTS
ncbi:SgcJ/EcaC family oxidoreductase [Telluribacter sp. SYSU D00476]|uniref:SgcJ/EcaC family oxidoreductase n=1 Tax=Telluribacter sp. SYSU D00476 TaxID=2811430 RepID=UPI001FF20FC7|nr:SgcJ/EcaC family oxidoreductase [Telluribacter sp. SYSU D00476]